MCRTNLDALKACHLSIKLGQLDFTSYRQVWRFRICKFGNNNDGMFHAETPILKRKSVLTDVMKAIYDFLMELATADSRGYHNPFLPLTTTVDLPCAHPSFDC